LLLFLTLRLSHHFHPCIRNWANVFINVYRFIFIYLDYMFFIIFIKLGAHHPTPKNIHKLMKTNLRGRGNSLVVEKIEYSFFFLLEGFWDFWHFGVREDALWMSTLHGMINDSRKQTSRHSHETFFKRRFSCRFIFSKFCLQFRWTIFKYISNQMKRMEILSSRDSCFWWYLRLEFLVEWIGRWFFLEGLCRLVLSLTWKLLNLMAKSKNWFSWNFSQWKSDP
jgi:hypothetical protein